MLVIKSWLTWLLFTIRVCIPTSRWCQQRICRCWLWDPGTSTNAAQSCRPVRVTGPLWGGRSSMSTSSRWSWEDQWARSSRCGYDAQHTGACLPVSRATLNDKWDKKYGTLDCGQSNVFPLHLIFSSIPPGPAAEIWPFEIFKMAAGRHLGFGPTGCSAFQSADPERTKHEVDRMTRCRDMAVWNVPKRRVGHKIYILNNNNNNNSLIYIAPYAELRRRYSTSM